MKKLCFLISLILIFLLCGCADYQEIDRGYLVTAIGFSTNSEGVSLFIEALSSSNMADKPFERQVLTAKGRTVESAFKNLKSSLVKPLYFEQLGAVIFDADFSDTGIKFLKNIPNINYGIYLVKTDDIKALFENDMPNGILGYDIITLIKTHEKESGSKVRNKLYIEQNDNFTLPYVNFSDGKLILEKAGKNI